MTIAVDWRPMAEDSTAVAELEDLEQYRRELTAYSYRMLGSAFEAEDAVQETMVRAWKNLDTFEGRSALRSWLYRITTNVCLDMLRSKQRRARPMDIGPSSSTDGFDGAQLPESAWLTPIPDSHVLPNDGDPAEVAAARESVRLAFVAALQHLPARQRAVLILREVLRWQASEVAELLDTTVASVNSALQRARATLASCNVSSIGTHAIEPEQHALLNRYLDAFERYDVSGLVALLHDDVVQSMPPFSMWLVGPDEIGRWLLGPGIGCKGSKVLTTAANGGLAFAQYRVDPAGGWAPWSIHVIESSGDKITGLHYFLDTRLFEAFGLPAHLDA
jgi:RNA polymerase sigma-70 factor (ECF subfamily)